MGEDNNSVSPAEETVDENKLIAQRREKRSAMREQGNAFPNGFRGTDRGG